MLHVTICTEYNEGEIKVIHIIHKHKGGTKDSYKRRTIRKKYYQLNEQNKNKELLIRTLKKTINSQNEKLSLTEKIRAQMSLQNQQIEENEYENNMMKTEYM